MNEELTINGTVYVPKSNVLADKLDDMRYVLVRTYSAGVFVGYLKEQEDQKVILKKARRIWYWDGAASLSQLSTEGTSKPENCKFPCEVETIELMQVIEIIDITKKAKESITNVKIWKQ